MTVHQLPLASAAKIPARADRDWVTSMELIAESGISYRQADYFCRTDLLHALPGGKVARRRWGDLPISPETPGSGYLRRFHTDQVDRALLIRHLLDAGINLQTVREHIEALLAEGYVDIGPVSIFVRAGESA